MCKHQIRVTTVKETLKSKKNFIIRVLYVFDEGMDFRMKTSVKLFIKQEKESLFEKCAIFNIIFRFLNIFLIT